MSTELDSRIRELVVRVVDGAPLPPDLDPTGEPARQAVRFHSRSMAVVAIAASLVLGAILAVSFVGRSGSDQRPSVGSAPGETVVSLDAVPTGVSSRVLAGQPVWIVRHGTRARVFLDSAQHLPGEKLWWCPTERIFGSPGFGEAFNESGRKLGGPSVRGLDRFPGRVTGGKLIVQTFTLIRGSLGNASIPRGLSIPGESTWDSGVGSFCRRALRGPNLVAFPLADLPEGVTSSRVGRTPVFIVRDGDRVTTFLTNVHHLAGERTLWWCPASDTFYSPTHGEQFERIGDVYAGPANRGLDRLVTETRAGRVTIRTDRPIHGQPRTLAAQERLNDVPACTEQEAVVAGP